MYLVSPSDVEPKHTVFVSFNMRYGDFAEVRERPFAGELQDVLPGSRRRADDSANSTCTIMSTRQQDVSRCQEYSPIRGCFEDAVEIPELLRSDVWKTLRSTRVARLWSVTSRIGGHIQQTVEELRRGQEVPWDAKQDPADLPRPTVVSASSVSGDCTEQTTYLQGMESVEELCVGGKRRIDTYHCDEAVEAGEHL